MPRWKSNDLVTPLLRVIPEIRPPLPRHHITIANTAMASGGPRELALVPPWTSMPHKSLLKLGPLGGGNGFLSLSHPQLSKGGGGFCHIHHQKAPLRGL